MTWAFKSLSSSGDNPMRKEGSSMNEGKVLQFVTFKLENEEFGVDMLKVQEINRMMNITIEGLGKLGDRLPILLELEKIFASTGRKDIKNISNN
jgi:chemotaxis signal transduction protein